MKKIIIYVILSLVLVAPIATIVAIIIMSSGDMVYNTSETFSNDFSSLETTLVSTDSFEEEIETIGTFFNDTVKTITATYESEEKTQLLHEVGEYLKAGDTLFIAEGKKHLCSEDCMLIESSQQGQTVTVSIRPLKVTTVKVALPVENYYCANNSTISFQWGSNLYEDISCTELASHSDETGKTFIAEYAVNENSFVYGGQVNVTVKTGKTVENALSVPMNYIYLDEDGRYYIEVLSEDSVSKVYVDLGMFGHGRVQIICSGNEQLTSNTSIVANSVDVFNKTTGEE